MKTKITHLFAIGLLITSSSFAADKPLQEAIKNVMQMEHRNAEDKIRDANRNPLHALEFFEFKQNMKVIELGPGNGWYTKILAPLLEEKGTLHLAWNKEWLKGLDPLLTQKGFSSTTKLPMDIDWNGKESRYEVGNYAFNIDDADMVLSIRDYHNFDLEGKNKLNQAVFNALKPGGLYIVIDHTRRHMKAETRELNRREDPVKVILEIQNAGFQLEKSSDMFFRADDELRYEVGRKTVMGNTDRFTLVFRKPM